jgi:potassium efflux system protein
MGTTGAGRLAAGIVALLIGLAASRSGGEEPARRGTDSMTGPSAPEMRPSATVSEAPAPGGAAALTRPAGGPSEALAPGGAAALTRPSATLSQGERVGAAEPSDAKAARAEAQEALKRLEKPSEPETRGAAAISKALREVLEERIRWLDEWDKVTETQARFEGEPSPERQATAVKAELERLKALLERASRDPDSLLAGVFRSLSGPVMDAVRAEMKETLEAAKSDWNDWKTKLEKFRAEAQGGTASLSTRRVERDRTYQRVAALKSRKDEREAASAAAKTPEEARLARERLINLAWESRVESQRLILQEAQLAREAASGDLRALELQVLETHTQLAARTFECMQRHYALITEAQERKLAEDAASEQKRAATADDPLVKYRARRAAELLELQAQVLKFENPVGTNLYPALEEQRALADHAVADFAEVKALVEDGKVSHLDALRLNNDFRRIGPERARIVSHALATAATQLTFYENALSSVEMDLINDSRDDRLQNEDQLQRLPPSSHAKARAVFAAIEERHVKLLERKRLALEKLAARAEETHRQVERRLKTLDDQYGYIRTHIFWVRDQEPISAVTLAQCRREAALLGRSVLPLVQEACDRSLWGRISPEFVVATLALIGLPWPLSRLRKKTQ